MQIFLETSTRARNVEFITMSYITVNFTMILSSGTVKISLILNCYRENSTLVKFPLLLKLTENILEII